MLKWKVITKEIICRFKTKKSILKSSERILTIFIKHTGMMNRYRDPLFIDNQQLDIVRCCNYYWD